jgi:hypothetical protein
MEETLEMSKKEIDRHAVLVQVQQKKLKQIEAAKILQISDRQIRNLLYELKIKGARGLISKKRGKRSNCAKPAEFKRKVLSLVASKYEGFGPTFASEKLEELNGIQVHHETLRQWMIEGGIWNAKEKKRKIHPPREKRACFGELIQVDGSHHHWFGPDMPKATLLVFIDDATSKVTALHFCEQETLKDYFRALDYHLKEYGLPRDIYSDRLKVFNGEKNLSQFQCALKKLEVGSILARSPQAKGRVERANRTLQDRLLKEMALRDIKTIEEANRYLPEYLKVHNKKFSMEPASPFNAHRPLEKGLDLERILCRFEERTLSKDYTFDFHNRSYIIMDRSVLRRPKGVKIEVRVTGRGAMRVFLKDKELEFRALSEIYEKILEREEPIKWESRAKETVGRDHPWRRFKIGKETVRRSKERGIAAAL